MAFSEFYMQNGGNNVNAGSTTNNTAAYTSTNGNWSTVTNIFTPTDGSTPASSVNVGDFASVYIDAATTAVYIARVTVVAAGANGAITLSTTAIYGTAPTLSINARSIKVGGAWGGPSGAATFPFGLTGTIGTLVNSTGNYVRLNAKNDQTYTMTASLTFASLGIAIMQGYTSSVGDLGQATFTCNITSAANFTSSSNNSQAFADLIFISTGASGTNDLFQAGVSCTFLRCVFHGARGNGLRSGTNPVFALECEAYDCNKSNTANLGGFVSAGSASVLMCINCYSHDHASGSNANGYSSTISPGSLILMNCIADTCAGSGVAWGQGGAGVGIQLISVNTDYYNNVDGIKLNVTSAGNFAYISNNNFIKNSGKGINNVLTGQGGIIYNNGRGSGTQANGGADALGSILDTSTDVTYASGLVPWTSPATGNFTIALTTANFAGRQAFTETDGTNSGTAGHPDIGSAQSLTGPGGTFSKEVSYNSG